MKIIVDIDGTLCDISDRLHLVKGKKKKDWDAFFNEIPNDKPRLKIIKDVKRLSKTFEIHLVSGRPERYRLQTLTWLRKHGVPFSSLHMRKDLDRRDDTIVKQEILNAHFNKKDIALVIDDRPRVIRMWRENGLTVADVGNGIEF